MNQQRTRLERRLIRMCRDVLDASEAHDVNAEEMAREIRFVRKVLEIWEHDGAEKAADSALCGLMFARLQREKKREENMEASTYAVKHAFDPR